MKEEGRLSLRWLAIFIGVVAVMGLCCSPALAEDGKEGAIVLQPGEDYRDYIEAPPLESLFDGGVFEEAFGLRWQTTFIGAADFAPVDPVADAYRGNVNGFIYPASGSAGRYRAVVRLPSGVKIVGAFANLYDGHNANIWWSIRVVRANGIPITLGDCAKTTSGIPGWTYPTCLPNAVVANSILGQYIEMIVDMADVGVDHRLFGVHLVWHRQVRTGLPNPFDDIGGLPSRFQNAIKALAASGITKGCDANSYCPSSPVNRGQMAVFLAEALGLHWDSLAGY